VFDFASGSMTHEKMQTMKQNLNKEFGLIFSLCDYILQNSTDVTLLSTTLKTLLRFLQWIPVVFIFETKLIETLALKVRRPADPPVSLKLIPVPCSSSRCRSSRT
jgi:exportin-1